MPLSRIDAAGMLQQLMIESSPLIEEYTRELCPVCTDVCCRQKHGIYRERDILYLNALGTAIPARDPARPLDGPCEAIGERGCAHPRWLRPFKCTWYFCDPLLEAMNDGPQKKARALSRAMKDMIECYDKLKG
ncbi:MAG: hypothetical protein AABZ15_06255 [Nitrospirota bacterium]